MSAVPDIRAVENREKCRDFVHFVQSNTGDLGTFVAYEHDGWLIVATWDGSGFNDRLRDMIAAEGGKPQKVAEPT